MFNLENRERIQPPGQKENAKRQLIKLDFLLFINSNISLFPFIDGDFSLVKSFQ